MTGWETCTNPSMVQPPFNLADLDRLMKEMPPPPSVGPFEFFACKDNSYLPTTDKDGNPIVGVIIDMGVMRRMLTTTPEFMFTEPPDNLTLLRGFWT